MAKTKTRDEVMSEAYWTQKEKEDLNTKYSTSLVKENCNQEEMKDKSLPSDAYIVTYKIGDSVNAVVLSIDAESKKISLGVKQLENNPWDGIEENIKVGEKYKGTVSNIVQNGAYILLENDIEGFLNVSDISWTRKVKNASDILKNE